MDEFWSGWVHARRILVWVFAAICIHKFLTGLEKKRTAASRLRCGCACTDRDGERCIFASGGAYSD